MNVTIIISFALWMLAMVFRKRITSMYQFAGIFIVTSIIILVNFSSINKEKEEQTCIYFTVNSLIACLVYFFIAKNNISSPVSSSKYPGLSKSLSDMYDSIMNVPNNQLKETTKTVVI